MSPSQSIYKSQGNHGSDADQAILHVHFYLVARYVVGVEDSRGDLRWVFLGNKFHGVDAL